MALDAVALRASGLGDVLTAVPALRALADEYDGVCLATVPWLFPLAPLIPGVTSTAAVDGMLPRLHLSDSVVFNLHGSGPQSHVALLTRAPRQLVAFRCDPVWTEGPDWDTDEEESERERLCRLVRSVGIPADAQRVEIHRPRPIRAGSAVLHVGGKDGQRRWPPANFAALARCLVGHDVVITGGPDDVGVAEHVARLAGFSADRVLAGKLQLDEFARLVAGARVIVCGDTGAAHLAYALGTPAVVIFGPASPVQWGPPTSAEAILLRADGTEPRAADVGVEDAVKAVISLLDRS